MKNNKSFFFLFFVFFCQIFNNAILKLNIYFDTSCILFKREMVSDQWVFYYLKSITSSIITRITIESKIMYVLPETIRVITQPSVGMSNNQGHGCPITRDTDV